MVNLLTFPLDRTLAFFRARKAPRKLVDKGEFVPESSSERRERYISTAMEGITDTGPAADAWWSAHHRWHAEAVEAGEIGDTGLIGGALLCSDTGSIYERRRTLRR